jgi:hypothetical protein
MLSEEQVKKLFSIVDYQGKEGSDKVYVLTSTRAALAIFMSKNGYKSLDDAIIDLINHWYDVGDY